MGRQLHQPQGAGRGGGQGGEGSRLRQRRWVRGGAAWEGEGAQACGIHGDLDWDLVLRRTTRPHHGVMPSAWASCAARSLLCGACGLRACQKPATAEASREPPGGCSYTSNICNRLCVGACSVCTVHPAGRRWTSLEAVAQFAVGQEHWHCLQSTITGTKSVGWPSTQEAASAKSRGWR